MADTENGHTPLAEQVADKAKQQTQQVKDGAQQVKDQATQVVQQGQQRVSHIWEVGRTQFRGALTGQKDRAADGLGDLAQMLQQSATQMKEQGQAGGASIAQNLGNRVSTLSETIHGKEIEEILADTESFAREKPAVFLALATLLGFILARFLKSSGQAASAA